MTKEEIAKIMNLPFPQLAENCKDPEILAVVISLAIQMGINHERDRVHKQYNQMFRGYNKVSIEN